ncbi:hypothetical protein LINPERPRIM_LOCUS20221 [Linum perenne]
MKILVGKISSNFFHKCYTAKGKSQLFPKIKNSISSTFLQGKIFTNVNSNLHGYYFFSQSPPPPPPRLSWFRNSARKPPPTRCVWRPCTRTQDARCRPDHHGLHLRSSGLPERHLDPLMHLWPPWLCSGWAERLKICGSDYDVAISNMVQLPN